MKHVQRILVIAYYLGLLILRNFQGYNDLRYIEAAIITNFFCFFSNLYISQYQKTKTNKRLCIKMALILLPLVIFCFEDPNMQTDQCNYLNKLQYLMFGLELSQVSRQKISFRLKLFVCIIIGALTVIILSIVTILSNQNTKGSDILQLFTFEIVLIGEIIFLIRKPLTAKKTQPKQPPTTILKFPRRGSSKKAIEISIGDLEIKSVLMSQAAEKSGERSYKCKTLNFCPQSKQFQRIDAQHIELYNLSRMGDIPIVVNEDDAKMNSLHKSASIKQSQHGDQHGYNSGTEYLVKNQKDFFKSLFNQFPDGMVILGEDSKIQHINLCIRNLLGTKSRKATLQKLLELKSCSSKVQEQAQFQKLFKVLNTKLQTSKNDLKNSSKFEVFPSVNVQKSSEMFPQDHISENENEDSVENEQSSYNELLLNIETYISQSATVYDEYLKGIKQLQLSMSSGNITQIQNNINQVSSSHLASSMGKIDLKESQNLGSPQHSMKSVRNKEKIRFLSQVKMLCFDRDEEDDDDQLDDDFQKSPSFNIKQKRKLIEITLKPYIFENKPYIFFIVRDVSLFNQYSVLQQVNQNKSKMLAQVAHEFRTPLSCIIYASESLLEKFEHDQELCQKFFSPVLSQASQLLSLVNDLLDLAQLKAGKFKITQQVFDLKSLLYEIATMLTPSIKSKGLYLNLVVDTLLFSSIKSDPNRIRQIIINLISNAIKFTQTGGITLEVKNRAQNILQISVKDTGTGISREDQARLFQEFGKLEDKSQMNTQGVGLGLMISYIMAQKLGAKQSDVDDLQKEGLKVFSEGIGFGSCFSFDIYNQYIFEEVNSMNQSKNLEPFFEHNSANVISSQLIDKDVGKVTFTFDVNNDKQKYFNDKTYSFVKKPRYQTINLGLPNGKSNQKTRLKNLRLICNIPSVIRESSDPFSPQGLDQIEKSTFFENQFYFKQCNCSEILIVDDEKFNIDSLMQYLSKYQLKIDYALSGDEALQKLKDKKKSECCLWIRVILMDIEMGRNKDGLQTTMEIRAFEEESKKADEKFNPSYIIALSGHEGDKQKAKCLKAGMDDMKTKPLKAKDFIQVIQSLIKQNFEKG